MKKLFILLLFTFVCFSSERKLSNILSPDINIISLDANDCKKSCLLDLLKKGKYFSFLENYSYDEQLDTYYQKLTKHLKIKKLEVSELLDSNISFVPLGDEDTFKVALLVPTKVIKHYTNSIYDSLNAYFMTKNINYELKVFDTVDENFQNIQKQINNIKEEGFSYIIAPFRKDVIPILNQNSNNAIIYVPTVSTSDVDYPLSTNIVLGGIDYDEHIDLIVQNLGSKSILINYPSKKSKYIEEKFNEKFEFYKSYTITDTNMDSIIKNNKRRLERASFVLNTPLVKSSSIISKLKFHDINSSKIYSIQNLYNPNIFELLQSKDLYNIRITNSIAESNNKNLAGIGKLLGNDIKFNWVNYSSLIGIDYLYSEFSGDIRDFEEDIMDNKVEYNTNTFRIKRGKFLKLAP